MNEDDFVILLKIYGSAILVMLVIVGALFYLKVFKLPEKNFNPELHDCVQWEYCLEVDNLGIGKLDMIGNCTYCAYELKGEKASAITACGDIPKKCVSWQPKKDEVVEEHSPLRNFTEAELHCLSSPEDEDKCECVEFSDNLLKGANETRLILPEGITEPPSGFAGGICGYGRGFNTSCTAWNFTKGKGCFIAVPRELSFKEECLSKEWNYATISDTSFGTVETCSLFNTTPEFEVYLYNSTNAANNKSPRIKEDRLNDCVSWQLKKEERSEQKPAPETTSSLTIKLINSSDSITAWWQVQLIPCECCKTNTCPNLSNPRDLEELNLRQCGYAYRDYINRIVSEPQRETAKAWLVDECNGVMTMGTADYCRNNPSDSEKCECVRNETKGYARLFNWLIRCRSDKMGFVNFTFTNDDLLFNPTFHKSWTCQSPELVFAYVENINSCVEAVPK